MKRTIFIIGLFVLLSAIPQLLKAGKSDETWSVAQSGEILQFAYGSGTNFPQYGALHLDSGYFRLNYGPTSGWGTSTVLLPAFWSGGDYYQGAPVTATWQVDGPDLLLSVKGTITTALGTYISVSSSVSLSPPTGNAITGRVRSEVIESTISLDSRPGEVFKPVMLSSMHISSSLWDTQAAYADRCTFLIPTSGWIVRPPVHARMFGLQGGTSDWKVNAPTVEILLDRTMQISGWVSESSDPNDDNVALWAASDSVLPSWSYKITSSKSRWPAFPNPLARAYQHLEEVMDKYHKAFDVYTDLGAAGNHFVHRAMLGTDVTMDCSTTEIVHSGCSAIKNTFSAYGSNWGGWYLQNGVLLGDDVKPRDNWGDYANAGYDLRGATKLTFWARGEQGGERVEFFAFGIGRDPWDGSPIEPYPDSEAKVTLGGRLVSPYYITLENDWRQYTIGLADLDLSYVIGGFGWVTNAPENNDQSITFYLDDIRYDKSHLDDLRFLVSYETLCSDLDVDTVLRNVAFTYDNALALIAFIAAGDRDRARLLADAFVYAQQHDRYYDYYVDGRLRNAYKAGDLIIPPGWVPNDRVGTVRMPGWWNEAEQKWYEDEGLVGSGTGNLAWAMISLLHYYERWGGEQYLAAVIKLGEWIESNTSDTLGAWGYTGGYMGWEPDPSKFLWKSTEHNIDLYVAFERLYRVTGDSKWQDRAGHARNFVESMWNEEQGFYWTGTLEDGVTVNTQTIPLDTQTWSLSAFGINERTRRAIAYAETNHQATWGSYEGFDFNDDRDMPWFEGTAQMVVAYWMLGDFFKGQLYRDELREVQATVPNGNEKGIVAAPAEGLTTGFGWLYFNRLHVGATAWFIFAELGYNPYWQTIPIPAPLVYYTFETGDEGWSCSSPPPPTPTLTPPTPTVFAHPDCFWESGFLKLISHTNTNTFGYWQSPQDAIPADADYLYRARFTVSTDITATSIVPQIRLRANSLNLQQYDVLSIESAGDGGACPATEGTDYDLYFVPPSNDTAAMLAFDLLNFNPNDAAVAELLLDTVTVDRFALDSLSTPTVVQDYTFELSQDGWTTGGAPIAFSSPQYIYSSGALELRAITNTNTFGFWGNHPADITIEADKLYRGTFEIRTDLTNPALVPEMRLRYNTGNLQASHTFGISSSGDGANSPGTSNTTYDRLYFLPPANCVGSGLVVSFDILNFSPVDAPTASLILDRAVIETLSPPALP